MSQPLCLWPYQICANRQTLAQNENHKYYFFNDKNKEFLNENYFKINTELFEVIDTYLILIFPHNNRLAFLKSVI